MSGECLQDLDGQMSNKRGFYLFTLYQMYFQSPKCVYTPHPPTPQNYNLL